MVALDRLPNIDGMGIAFREVGRVVAVVAISALVASCTAHVTVKPIEMPEAHGAQIPATLGVYYPAGFSDHPVREQLSPEFESLALEADIGPASRSVLDAILRSAFAEVIEVDSANPAELAEGRVDAITVPKIVRFNYELHSGNTIVDVAWELELVHRDGRSQTLAIDGRDDYDPGNPLGIEFLYTAAPRKIASAIRDAGTALWFRFNAVAGEDDWFGALERRSEAERTELEETLAPGEGRCVVFVFVEDFVESMQGAIVLAGDDDVRWLPDASRYARFDLDPGAYTLCYGPAALVQLLAGSEDKTVPEFTDSVEVDCEAGGSHTYGLRFRSIAELEAEALPPATAVRELQSRKAVTASDSLGPMNE